MSYKFRGRILNFDKISDNKSGIVDGYYYQETINGESKHYIFNGLKSWEVDPATVRCIYSPELGIYENPVTNINNIKELQEILVQTIIDYIKEHNLSDIWSVSFSVDGLMHNAIKYGEWVPSIDSSISIEGLKLNDKNFYERKEIGSYM